MSGSWKGIVGLGFTADAFDTYVANIALIEWRPELCVLHNTAAPRLSEWHSTPGAARMQNLQHFYRDIQHWSAGPHLFVADDLIWTFTPLTTSGVHSPSWNGISWGIEMVGDYDSESFGNAVRENTIRALTALHRMGGLDPTTLRMHHEDPLTTHRNCPGKNVDTGDIIAAVTAALAK